MAKRSSSGWGFLVLLVIGLIASIPKEVWVTLGTLLLIGGGIYLYVKSKSNTSVSTSTTQPEYSTSHFLQTRSYDEPHVDQAVTSANCWNSPGKAVTVKGLTFPDGMLYVGRGLASVMGYDVEPALINPALPIKNFEGQSDQMPYWPSYYRATPTARGEYLHWLANGRSNPTVQMGCVFLFFYGIERRLLWDAKTHPEEVAQEAPLLLAEIERLLRVYGENNSFRGYATSLLDFLRLKAQPHEKLYQLPPPEAPAGYHLLTLSHRLALGQAALDGAPLPGEWAYSWFTQDPRGGLRAAARRVPDGFKKLFLDLYQQRHDAGIRLPVNKTKLKLIHRPASGSFGHREIMLDPIDLPDVTVLERPFSQLREVADEATEMLGPYSRFIGRNPDKNGTMDAIVLLPPSLWPDERVRSLQSWVEGIGANRDVRTTTFAELMQHFPAWGPLNRERAANFASALEHFGVGMEPDVRWGGGVPEDGVPVVLFTLSGKERGKKPSAAYGAAALTLHLAAAVSAADGVSAEEEALLEESLERWLHLEAPERARLRAYLKWLLLSQPSLTRLKKRVSWLDESQRRAIAAFVMDVAHVEGVLNPAEVKVLAKIYRLLGLDEQELYSRAHAAATEPVVVKPAAKAGKRFQLPPKPAADTGVPAAALDAERVARLKAESEAVSAMLGAIFASEEAVAPEPEPPEQEQPTGKMVAGLDHGHSDFVRILVSRVQWTRAELQDLAADLGVLLDGALEHINEAFLDNFGEPLFEGSDPIEINRNAAKELTAA